MRNYLKGVATALVVVAAISYPSAESFKHQYDLLSACEQPKKIDKCFLTAEPE